MNRSTILLFLPLLAGCNVHSKNPDRSGDNVNIHADESGHVTFNLPIAQGQVKVPTSFMHKGNFDIEGVKLMPGSSVTGFNLDASHGNANVDMSFTAPASPDQVRSYFLDQFREKGVEVALAGDSVTGKTKDGDPFTIQVGAAPNGSQGKVVIQSKD